MSNSMEHKGSVGSAELSEANSFRLGDKPEKTYLEMSPQEMELDMQQAVINHDVADQDAFVTLFDDAGRMYRHYEDGRGANLVSGEQDGSQFDNKCCHGAYEEDMSGPYDSVSDLMAALNA